MQKERSITRDMDINTFCAVFNVLEPFPAAVQKLDKWGSPYKSQKAHVIDWFSTQDTTGGGAYTRQNGNRSAKACYNRLLKLNKQQQRQLRQKRSITASAVPRSGNCFRLTRSCGSWKILTTGNTILPWKGYTLSVLITSLAPRKAKRNIIGVFCVKSWKYKDVCSKKTYWRRCFFGILCESLFFAVKSVIISS